MPDYIIGGVPVSFPFEPYPVQTAYMEKVIECLKSGTNGVLESPTGTGKTLSLLCSTLGWLMTKKAQVQAMSQTGPMGLIEFDNEQNEFPRKVQFSKFKKNVKEGLDDAVGEGNMWGTPKIIYASRTHSQLNQAMQELKRTNYNNLRASVLGSRDQMCINPQVMKETNNANKIHLCHLKVQTRTCYHHHGVEKVKDQIALKEAPVLDIEDLVKLGRKHSACPYYLSKELRQTADIVFMPYNYLLDPKARRANKIELHNTVIILDEAHNVEKMCEDSASLQIKTTDLAVCIDEVTAVMRAMSENSDAIDFGDNQSKDFTAEDLADLKELLLALEKAIDSISVSKSNEGTTYPGSYIFEILAQANITDANFTQITTLLESLVQFLATTNDTAFGAKGAGLQKIADLLRITFSSDQPNHKEEVKRCYKVHLEIEVTGKPKGSDNWLSAKTAEKTAVKVLSYWCFSPGFGMKQLLEKHVRCVILTSGTLAPLKPLISELAIPINVRLENPHIVDQSQVCVRIISNGPDNQILNSNYENRNNPLYIQSLGRTILSLCNVVPHGVLVFFPSYPVMAKCQDSWQASGLWQQMCRTKPIFVEPRGKDAFLTTMTDFYDRINDPLARGAIFMAVCRGKVSEGLDFADMNGRAVVITGLPFPPLKDPRVILKKKYLSDNRTAQNEFLSGDEWYSLEASRAVNQAVGRVIRHRHDYGAILLCDARFSNPRLKAQLSKWLQAFIKPNAKFGQVIGELSRFFRTAERTLPQPTLKPLAPEDGPNPYIDNKPNMNDDIKIVPSFDKPSSRPINRIVSKPKKPTEKILNANEATSWDPSDYKFLPKSSTSSNQSFFDRLEQGSKAINFNDMSSSSTSTSTQSLLEDIPQPAAKKRKLKIIANAESNVQPFLPSYSDTGNKLGGVEVKPLPSYTVPESRMDFLMLVKKNLEVKLYNQFLTCITHYKKTNSYEDLIKVLEHIFLNKPHLHFLFKGLNRFMKDSHKILFEEYWQEKQLS